MAALRKMLGRPDDPLCREMMALIDTQSLQTLAAWAADTAPQRYLPVYEAAGGEPALRQEAEVCRELIGAGGKPAALAPHLRELTRLARETQGAAAQAAARAVSVACGVMRSPGNALGFVFYGAAAMAYSQAGVHETSGVYDQLARQEWTAVLDSLKMAALPDEENPVKIDWNC